MNYCVYEIQIEGVRRYIGITNNIKRREKEHNRNLRGDIKKVLYKNIFMEKGIIDIKLNIIYEYKTKTEAVRMEAFLILKDWFNDRQLWQSPPRVVKYF